MARVTMNLHGGNLLRGAMRDAVPRIIANAKRLTDREVTGFERLRPVKRRPARGWAAVNTNRPHDEPNIWHVARVAREVRRSVGAVFHKDPAIGWKAALKAGWRVVKVNVTVEE